MFKIIFLLFTGLVRSLVEETPAGKFTITTPDAPPYTQTNCGEDWTGSVADDSEPTATGDHGDPFYAALGGTTAAVSKVQAGGDYNAISKRAATERCGEMLALFKDSDDRDDPSAVFKYIKIANFESPTSDALEIGNLACIAVGTCNGSFGLAVKLPQLQVITTSVFDNIMCPGFLLADSGDGSAKENPIYVYVDTATLFDSDHVDCGRIYGFGDKFVAVAGTTASSAAGDGLTLGILAADCDNVEICEMGGYAQWTGEIFAPTAAPTEDTTEDETTTATTSPTTSPGESTTNTEPELPTIDPTSSEIAVPSLDTTEGLITDSTFFAAVGFTLFALLA